MSSPASRRRPSSPRSPPCLKRHTVRLTRFARIRDLRAPRARSADQLCLDPITVPVKAGSPTSHYLSRGEPEATAPSIIASTTRRLNKMLECTSVTFGMHDGVSSNVASVAMKKKYAAVKSTSRSSVTRTQLSSCSTPAMLEITASTTPKGPRHSRGHSKHSSGPMVSKSLGLSPTREG